MPSVDPLLSRQYCDRTYHCAHFTAEAWEHLTGDPIADALSGFLAPPGGRQAAMSLRHAFVLLARPASPCIVLMDRPRSRPHVGIYWKGRVLHITKDGVQYMPLDIVTFGYKTVRFYSYANSHHS